MCMTLFHCSLKIIIKIKINNVTGFLIIETKIKKKKIFS